MELGRERLQHADVQRLQLHTAVARSRATGVLQCALRAAHRTIARRIGGQAGTGRG
jgi:hypothetical protein